MSRARRTAELAGLHPDETEPGLSEWDYGDLEGRTTEEIRTRYPGWTIWRGPWPGGETAEQVYERLCGVLDQVRPRLAGGDVVLVAHGHSLRVLTLAWLGAPDRAGLDPVPGRGDAVGAGARAWRPVHARVEPGAALAAKAGCP